MHAQSYNDKELFQAISEGDENAFRKLFHIYVPQFRAIAQHITKTAAVTEDIIQETFLRLWISRDKLPDIEQPRSWMLRIVFYQSFTYLRKQAVHHKALDTLAPIEPAFSMEENMAYASMIKQVGIAVAQLPPRAQQIYRLSREQGLKIPEIAQQLSLSSNTVKNSLVRSLQAIRKHLEASGHLLPALILWLLRL
ncbi:sigma-70 family RNA polymerase sigma factor [Chitinophaga polysaccharea]|uniref:RNA polymerase sigma factor n=1 Tax=Chitinophaga TaxID=79328 RepID=UPI001454E58F|nr:MULTISPECIES: sigma-70 family RNA polymerase sigma factor [Chitinophaga]NLR58239.1 sigma-70 family RNA polymerase sigma factor [Chitinophaga polysaccharea]NLU90765.1 sigma-70 family RNA polymerase sigma factor [Chitinophaga sp. Ak27]